MAKHTIVFNAVVETEVKITKHVEITDDELITALLNKSNYDEESQTLEIDEVNEESDEVLNDMLLGIVPDELKRNCVSMTFTDIRLQKIN